MTDEEVSSDDENEQTGGGHRQTELVNEAVEDESSDDQSEPDYGYPKCPECGRSKMWDRVSLKLRMKMKNLKMGMTNQKQMVNMKMGMTVMKMTEMNKMNLKVEMTNQKQVMNLKMVVIIMKMSEMKKAKRIYRRKIKYGRQLKY